ncbi:MAG: TRAP transporter small permease [Alphaproteobacteria bacterium]|nr:TRAP transporter small permease [Alphaproteobacteria bacterium]
MRALYAAIAAAARWLAYGGLACLGVAGLVTLADIVLRALTRAVNPFTADPIGLAVPGVVDLVQLFVMGAAFAAMPFAFLSDGQVTVNLLADRLPPRGRAAMKSAAALLSAGFMGLVVWTAWGRAAQVLSYGDTSSTIEIPMIWYWTPLIGGCAASVAAALAIAAVEELRAAGVEAPPPLDPATGRPELGAPEESVP